MAGLRRLNRVDRKSTDGIDRQLLHFWVAHKYSFGLFLFCFQSRHFA